VLKIFKNSWNKRILTLAVPIVLGNLTQPVLAFVNTFISGRLPGPYALGGVALANVFFNFVFWGFGFLRMGSSGLVAQAYGAEDWEKIRLIVWRYLSIALFIGLCVLLLGHPLVFGAMNLLGATGRVRECAFVFCNIGIFSAPAVLMNYVITGALFGSQRVKIALVIQAVIYMSNAYLSLLLAYWLGMGVAGIALANLSADYLGLVLGFWALIYYRPRILAHVEFSALFHVPELIKLLLINRDLFVRTICLLFAFGWLARNGARQGDLILAGNTLLLNFQSFGAYAMDAFSNAAEALVGEAIGAKKRQDFLNCVKVSIVWSFIVAGVFSVIYLVFGREIDQSVRGSLPRLDYCASDLFGAWIST
jgi:MATE family multidrug resistance protein